MSYDANGHLRQFHEERVFVNEEMLDTPRQRREANRERLERGLDDAKEPKPYEFVPQGSYAMRTMVQSETITADIDDGAVFDRDALKGNREAHRTPREAKEMVCKALSAKNEFKKPPEVRRHCVRVYYNDGFNVDIPVYRTYEENGDTKKELAAVEEWQLSSPEDVTEWFVEQVDQKSPEDKGSKQMRRIVRLMKAWARSRSSWNNPTGFVITVLVDEAYPVKQWLNRDDQALLAVMRSIHNRISMNERVYRPVAPREEITSDQTLNRIRFMREVLPDAITELSKLESTDCDELTALKALKKLFNTDFWDDRIAELEKGGGDDGGGSGKTKAIPAAPVIKKGGTGQYA